MHTMWFPSPDMMRDNDSAIITTIMIYTDADEASLATLRYVIMSTNLHVQTETLAFPKTGGTPISCLFDFPL
jgi:hypothetical protein